MQIQAMQLFTLSPSSEETRWLNDGIAPSLLSIFAWGGTPASLIVGGGAFVLLLCLRKGEVR